MVKVSTGKNQQRRKKKKTRWKLVKERDAEFSRNLRMKNANKDGLCTCYTCGKVDHWKKMQCWHFVSRSVYALRWCWDNVRVQCYRCNVALSWNYIEYTMRMIDEVGVDKVEELRSKKYEVVKIETWYIEEEIARLKEENKELEKNFIS